MAFRRRKLLLLQTQTKKMQEYTITNVMHYLAVLLKERIQIDPTLWEPWNLYPRLIKSHAFCFITTMTLWTHFMMDEGIP